MSTGKRYSENLDMPVIKSIEKKYGHIIDKLMVELDFEVNSERERALARKCFLEGLLHGRWTDYGRD